MKAFQLNAWIISQFKNPTNEKSIKKLWCSIVHAFEKPPQSVLKTAKKYYSFNNE
jgi:hypothetical protein